MELLGGLNVELRGPNEAHSPNRPAPGSEQRLLAYSLPRGFGRVGLFRSPARSVNRRGVIASILKIREI